ncbi:hypothetical protein A5886_001212 [Enterococcus sp. 8G7_MSG3316]|uniref:Uncharacterized protein n=1 Tax=Candidatus Enterococcus testudinis TaxID=1834191 RepID=A0A242A524_9ENTE|nr:hypothetical protein [Enterococcus sp. 8G7_MSG3316]OTN76135.1 hypothetical protein A5886_001212 [Enterococcus sp. 8G7_MSG3316]
MKNEEKWMKFRTEFIENQKSKITLQQVSPKVEYLSVAGSNSFNIYGKSISRNTWPR